MWLNLPKAPYCRIALAATKSVSARRKLSTVTGISLAFESLVGMVSLQMGSTPLEGQPRFLVAQKSIQRRERIAPAALPQRTQRKKQRAQRGCEQPWRRNPPFSSSVSRKK